MKAEIFCFAWALSTFGKLSAFFWYGTDRLATEAISHLIWGLSGLVFAAILVPVSWLLFRDRAT